MSLHRGQRVAAVVSAVLIAAAGSSHAQQVDLRGLAACEPTTVDTSAWQRASYGRVNLRLPSDFRFDERAGQRFAHGGSAWKSDRREVTVSMGTWPSITSPTWPGTKCRLDIGNRSVMRTERHEGRLYLVNVLVWEIDNLDPRLNFQPLLMAVSESADDLPLLRAIASSVYGF